MWNSSSGLNEDLFPAYCVDDETAAGVLPLIKFCAEKWPGTNIMVISTAQPLLPDVMEQLDLSNVRGIYGKPIDAEAVTDIAAALEDIS